MASDLTVHHPARRHDVGAGLGLRDGDPSVQLDGGVVVDGDRVAVAPSSTSTPQWPWSVYSSRQRSASSTRSSPTSSRRSRSASCTMPSGSQRLSPRHPWWPARRTGSRPGRRGRRARRPPCAATPVCAARHRAATRSAAVRRCPRARTAARSGRRRTAGSRPPCAGARACGATAAAAAGGRPSAEG